MKILLTAFMLAISTVALSAETNDVVYLGEFGLPKIKKEWIGQTAGSVLNEADISQFIITKSASSAPLELHTNTIKRWLKEGFAFQDPQIEKPMDFFFDAIILVNDGRRIRVRMNRSWLCLTCSSGSGYIFTGKGESSNRVAPADP